MNEQFHNLYKEAQSKRAAMSPERRKERDKVLAEVRTRWESESSPVLEGHLDLASKDAFSFANSRFLRPSTRRRLTPYLIDDLDTLNRLKASSLKKRTIYDSPSFKLLRRDFSLFEVKMLMSLRAKGRLNYSVSVNEARRLIKSTLKARKPTLAARHRRFN